VRRWIAAAALALLLGGCTSPIKKFEERPVKADAALLKAMDVPVYPGAMVDLPGAMRTTMVVKSMSVESVTVPFRTTDGFAKVEAWYVARMPAASKVMDVHLGSGGMVTFQRMARGSMRQVSLVGIGSGTEIQLVATNLPTPSPNRATTSPRP
jgi:hypothetical protein